MMERSESLSELFTQLVKGVAGYVRAVVLDLAITSGKKAALFVAALTCVVLAIIYLSIGLINWLAMWFASLAAPYFIVALLFLIVGGVLMMLAGKKTAKDGKDAKQTREEEESETDA